MSVNRFSFFMPLLLLLLVTACSSTYVAPLAPTGLTAVADGNKIVLTWEDNSTNELGFTVYRAELDVTSLGTQGLSGAEQRANMQQLADLPENTTTFEDTTVVKGKRYRYAVNARGQSTVSAISTAETSTSESDDAPIADDVTITTTEETPVTITLTGQDAEGAALTFTVLTQPTSGTLSGTAPTLTYTPDSNFVGTDSFTYHVNDGEQDSETATVSITVTNVNDVPVFISTPVEVAKEGLAYSYTIEASDVDANETLSITAPTNPAWLSLTDNGDGTATLTGTPTNADAGTHDVSLMVTDSAAATATQSFTIMVSQNNAPVIAGDDVVAITMSEDNAPAAFDLTLSATDADDDTLSWQISSAASNGAAAVVDGVVSYTPTMNYNGSDSFVVEVTDGFATDTVTVNVTIDAVNDAPVIDGEDTVAVTMSEDASPTAFDLTLSATDAETASTSLSWRISSDPAHGSAYVGTNYTIRTGDITPQIGFLPGEVYYAPNTNFNGTDSFEVEVSDGTLTDTITVNVTVEAVNDAPVFDSTPVTSGSKDTLYSYAIETSDVDGDTLTITASTKPAWLSLTDNGDGTTTLSGTPTETDTGTHSIVLAVSDGTLSTTQSYTLNVAIITQVSAGYWFSLGLKGDGTVVAWGYNGSGQTDVPSGLSNVTAISAGIWHSMALKEDGTVVAWGQNNYGQTDVPSGLSNVVAISANYEHNLALKEDGTVVAWGRNYEGQTNVPAGLSNVTAIAAGFFHSLALKEDGTIVAWGQNNYGQTNVPSGLTDVIAIAAGEYYSLALKSDGTVVAWGTNYSGALDAPAGLSDVVAISTQYEHTLALKEDGTVVAWGYNGNGESTVPTGLSDVAAISAGTFHSLILKTDGTVIAWGQNNYGQTDVPEEFRGSID